MPRVTPRAHLASDLVNSSLHLLSVIKLTYQAPSYLPLQAFLHFELMKTGTLLLLNKSDEAVIFSMITLVRALETYLNGCLKLQEVKSKQDALREHCFRIGVILGKALEHTESIRYLEDRIYENRQELQQTRFSAVLNGSDRNFMRYARMSKESFFQLVPLIRDDPVFFNSSSRPQLPVEWQLLVTLCHLGLNGNGGSAFMIGQTFGLSEIQCCKSIDPLIQKKFTEVDSIIKRPIIFNFKPPQAFFISHLSAIKSDQIITMKNFNLFITILSTSFLPVIFSTWDTCSTWTWRPNMNTLGGELGHAGTCHGRYCPVCSNTYGTNNVTTAYGTGNHCISPSKTQEKTKCYYYDTNTKACIDGQRHKYTCQGLEKIMKCDSTACDYN